MISWKIGTDRKSNKYVLKTISWDIKCNSLNYFQTKIKDELAIFTNRKHKGLWYKFKIMIILNGPSERVLRLKIIHIEIKEIWFEMFF